MDRLEFREVDFTLTKAFPELELRMAPRALRGFSSALLKASDFTMELEQHPVKLSKWVAGIERQLHSKVSIGSAIASGIELEGGARAKISIQSPNDVRPGLAQLIPKHPFELETIEIEFEYDRARHKAVLSTDSTLRYGTKMPDDVLSILRSSFEATRAAKE
ncbi:MAG TPA: hypothetical protein VN577_20475 [Terriglobales bacterium]|nr:hypothetical protein [Terriglobales bacterium]